MDAIWSDLRYAVRSFRKSSGFTFVAVLTLALGIGANTAIFTVVRAVLIRPLPYGDAARLFRVYENVPASEMPNHRPRRFAGMDVRDFNDAKGRSRALSHLVSYGLVAATSIGGAEAVRLTGFTMAAAMAPMLGVQPRVGRWFTPDEEQPGRNNVVVLSDTTWRRLGGNSSIVGQRLTFSADTLNPMAPPIEANTLCTVIGVMPPGFAFPDEAQFWMPSVLVAPTDGRARRVGMIARLADGASVTDAAAELATIAQAVHGRIGPTDPARFEFVRIADEIAAPVRPALIVLTVAVGVVLLIGCTNVANLLLARTRARQREFAVRMAIGASRGRLIRQLLTESLLLSLIGGAAGVLFGFWCIRAFRVLAASMSRIDLGTSAIFPKLDAVTMDSTMFVVTLAISVICGLLFGLAPALRYSTSRGFEFGSGRAAPRILVVTEIAMATVLCVSGALLIQSFAKLAGTNVGFDPNAVLTFQVGLSGTRNKPDETRAFAETLADRLRSVPGVVATAYARQLPFVQLYDVMMPAIRRNGEWTTLEFPPPDVRFVSHDYLNTLGIRVISGRGFGSSDDAGKPAVVVINDAMARQDFGDRSPLGEFVYYGPPSRRVPYEIIGIVADVRQHGLDQDAGPQMFMDMRQMPFSGPPMWPPLFPLGAYYAVRTSNETAAMMAQVRMIVHQLDPQAAIDNVATMEQIVSNSVTRPRLYAVLSGILASIALALATIGLYGVMSYAVAQRTREFGIRIALGAARGDVIAMVQRQSLALVIGGLSIGLAGAAATSRYLQGLLFGLTPLDAATFVWVAVVFATVTMLASYVPARRATMVEPSIALRAE